MLSHWWRRGVLAGALATLLLVAVGAKPTPPPPIDVKISVKVVDPSGKPIQNAGVVLKQEVDSKGKKLKHPLDIEMKTKPDGTVTIAGFEPGIVLVQVIADGFRTWGQSVKMSKPDEMVNVKLQPPKGQVTIY